MPDSKGIVFQSFVFFPGSTFVKEVLKKAMRGSKKRHRGTLVFPVYAEQKIEKMKKSILALGVLMMAGVSLNAQDMNTTSPARTTTVSIGPVASFGHSWTSNLNGNVFKPSGALGVNVMIDKGTWGFGTSLTASHEGQKRQWTANGATMRETIDPTYIRLTPAFYAFPGHFTSSVRPMVYVGPSFGRRVVEDYYISNHTTGEQDNNHYAPKQFKDYDLGAVGGLGVSAQLGSNTWLNADASYYHGFFDAYNGNENRNVRVNLGLMFGL